MLELGEFTGMMRVEVLRERDGLAEIRVDRKLGREVRYYGNADLIEYTEDESDLEFGSDGSVVGYVPVVIERDVVDCYRVRTLGYDSVEDAMELHKEFRGDIRKRSVVMDPIKVNWVGK